MAVRVMASHFALKVRQLLHGGNKIESSGSHVNQTLLAGL